MVRKFTSERRTYWEGGQRVTPEQFYGMVLADPTVTLAVWGLIPNEGPWIKGRVQSLQTLRICPRCARRLDPCVLCGSFHRCDPTRISREAPADLPK